MASASSFGSRRKSDGGVSFGHGDEKRVILIDRNKVINESDAIMSLLRIMREIDGAAFFLDAEKIDGFGQTGPARKLMEMDRSAGAKLFYIFIHE